MLSTTANVRDASRAFFLLSLLAGWVALPRTAAAQGRDPSAADALFQQARDALARGDGATACARFAESQRLDPAPGTLLNVAKCEEKEGKLATSLAHLTEALETLPKDDFRIRYARAQLAALKPRVPTITVRLASGGAGARVTRDDIELREGSFGAALPVDPGPHVFVVRMEGHEDTREPITLVEGQQAIVTLAVGKPKPAAARTAAIAIDTTDGSGSTRSMAIASFTVAGAGLVTGVVTGLMFADAASTYRAHCDGTGCDDEGLAAASRGKTLNVVSPLAFGVAALGAGAGVYFWLKAKPSAARQGKLTVDPQISPHVAGLTLTGGF